MFSKDSSVIIDSEWSSFNGLRGVVIGEDTRRRPLPSILVYLPDADVQDHAKETYFTAAELRLVGPVDTTKQV